MVTNVVTNVVTTTCAVPTLPASEPREESVETLKRRQKRVHICTLRPLPTRQLAHIQ